MNRLDLSHLEDREVHQAHRALWDISAGYACLESLGLTDPNGDISFDVLFDALNNELKLRLAMKKAVGSG